MSTDGSEGFMIRLTNAYKPYSLSQRRFAQREVFSMSVYTDTCTLIVIYSR